jgi:iron complex transport system permease protein
MLWVLNISIGTVYIPPKQILTHLFSGMDFQQDTWGVIFNEIRLPKSITAILVGMGLGLAGLLMQTYFRNPMAGPSVLGISSGAGLGVALFLMSGSLLGLQNSLSFFGKTGLIVSAIFGSLFVLLLILVFSARLKNNLSILIIGIMISALSGSLVSVLSFMSPAYKLQQYMFWGFGSLSHLSYSEIGILGLIVSVGIIGVLSKTKVLNALLMGENFAQSVGVNLKAIQYLILIVTGILVGIITAYVGPIAFVGLAIPHIARMIFDTAHHKILIPAVLLLGASMLLLCDLLTQVSPSGKVIPINAITSLIGAPIVIYLILKQRKYLF